MEKKSIMVKKSSELAYFKPKILITFDTKQLFGTVLCIIKHDNIKTDYLNIYKTDKIFFTKNQNLLRCDNIYKTKFYYIKV